MSVCVSESFASQRALAAMYEKEDKREQAECGMRLHLAALVRQGDMSSPVTVAEPVPVREKGRYVADRFQTLSEVLTDAFDYSKGPKLAEVFAFLCRAANNGDAEAQALINRAIAEYARQNAEDLI